MFPTPDQLGIDLVLPDFTYLRERADDIEAIVLTHGHEDHVGALPFVLRELDRTAADLRRARSPSRWSAPSSTSTGSRTSTLRGRAGRARPSTPGPFVDRDGQDGPLDPGHVRRARPPASWAPRCVTGDYKFDQTPVDGMPADVARLAELGREGLLLLCGDSTNADRAGMSPSESSVGPQLRGGVRALRGPHRRHLLRLEHPPRAAGGGRRRGARAARSRWWAARCART